MEKVAKYVRIVCQNVEDVLLDMSVICQNVEDVLLDMSVICQNVEDVLLDMSVTFFQKNIAYFARYGCFKFWSCDVIWTAFLILPYWFYGRQFTVDDFCLLMPWLCNALCYVLVHHIQGDSKNMSPLAFKSNN